MSELWQQAGRRSREWDGAAHEYDRYRPRYPQSLFDDLGALSGLAPGAHVIEIGAGTGIATLPLVDQGFRVLAIEPTLGMAAVAQAKLGGRAEVVVGRFEDADLSDDADLVAAFNAWHWVDPVVAVPRVAKALRPGGCLALVWTEVVSWGEEPFETLVADRLGGPWPKSFDYLRQSMQPVTQDHRFEPFQERRHRFSRRLDAADTYLAVRRSYGGDHSPGTEQMIREIINGSCGGAVTKVEDAVLYLSRRR